MKARYLYIGLLALGALTWAALPGNLRAQIAQFTWNGLTWDYNNNYAAVFEKVGADTIYAETYQNVASYEVILSDLDGLDMGIQSYTVTDIADYTYLDFLVPSPDQIYFARVPRSKLTGPFPSAFYAVGSNADFARYTITGDVTTNIGLLSTDGNIHKLMSHNGVLYGVRQTTGDIFEIDIEAGAISSEAVATFGVFGGGLRGVESHNGTVYGLSVNGNFVSLDISDNTKTTIGDISADSHFADLASHSGTLYAIRTSGHLFTVNVSNGTSTALGTIGSNNWSTITSHDGALYAARVSRELHEINVSTPSATYVNNIDLPLGNLSGIASHAEIPEINEHLLVEIVGTSLELCVQTDLDWIEVHGIP